MRGRAGLVAVSAALLLAAVSEAPVYAAAPAVDYALSGTRGQNGWWVSNVLVHWSVSGATAATTGCEAAVLISTESAGTNRTCTAFGQNGSSTSVTTEPIKLDKTRPVATSATPERGSDYADWFNHPVTIAWSGTDNLTPSPTCTTTTYSGPDAATAQVAGTCTDEAGNISEPLTFGLPYDTTPPAVTDLTAEAGNRTATVRWKASPDTMTVRITRELAGRAAAAATIVFEGGTAGRFVDSKLQNDRSYTYRAIGLDAAGNAAARAVAVMPGRLLAPLPNARLTAPPSLSWAPVKRARYYNIQLFRGGRKILSLWPAREHVTLAKRWRFRGRDYRLRPGRYTWHVWPGYGKRSKHRYGRRVGRRDFVITR